MNLADLYDSTDDPHEKLLFVTIWLDATASAVRARLQLAEMGRDAREMAEYWRGFANGVELAQQELRALLTHIDWIEQDESGQWLNRPLRAASPAWAVDAAGYFSLFRRRTIFSNSTPQNTTELNARLSSKSRRLSACVPNISCKGGR